MFCFWENLIFKWVTCSIIQLNIDFIIGSCHYSLKWQTINAFFFILFLLLSEREILLMLRLALVKRGLDRTQHSFLRALSSSANSVSPRIRAKSIHLHSFTIEKKSLYNFKESENRWRDYWSNNVPFCPEPQNKKVFSMVWSLYSTILFSDPN